MQNKEIKNQIEKACKRIAPAWPLKNFVAVNPYLGLTDLKFNEAANVLSDRGGINMGMPKFYYLYEIEKNNISEEDVKKALNKNGLNTPVKEFLKEARFLSISTAVHSKYKGNTVVDTASDICKKDWSEFMVEKISNWASSYFDEIQAVWKTSSQHEDLFESWKKEAEVDASTEIMGINNFRANLKLIPNNPAEAAQFVLGKLDVPTDLLEAYLHTLMLKMVGWSSFVAGRDWDNGLYNGGSNLLGSFLSILLSWEYCLLESFAKEGLKEKWVEAKKDLANHIENPEVDEYLQARTVLQDAYDYSRQRELKTKFANHNAAEVLKSRPKAQAVFCIDVRSEVYRRNLESVDNEFETFGFAGFFGFSVDYTPMGHSHDHSKKLCPALIPASAKVKEVLPNSADTEKAIKKRLSSHQFNKIWKTFKSGAVSSFGFVSPMGLGFLPKIISDSFSLSRPVSNPDIDGISKLKNHGRELDLSAISLDEKIGMAAGALTAMNLGKEMAPLVLITGHGSTSVNNPHATGYDCGACGGNSGEINAMVAEKILNDKEVRAALPSKGVHVPSDTHFIACLHDTTTDEIKLVGEANVPASHQAQLAAVKASLEKATVLTRKERSLRFNLKGNDINKEIIKRSKDWAQVRPEWGLAGCSAFVVAPRHRTKGLDLEGKSFLQSYNWKDDKEFAVLESIMTAPMVVTSWINLQYFASTTDNEKLGSGNKTLHNITAGVGVLEGGSGDLRIGLPLQAVHDGEKFQHLPMRLNVIIEAPKEAINSIINKHNNVKELLDNQWITLMALEEDGKTLTTYLGDGNWESLSEVEKININQL